MKKLLATMLSITAVISCVAMPVQAADTESVGAGYIKVLGHKNLNNNKAYFFGYGLTGSNSSSAVSLVNVNDTSEYKKVYFKDIAKANQQYVTKEKAGYMIGTDAEAVFGDTPGGSFNKYRLLRFDGTGGRYTKIRLKLVNHMDDYFNENGTHTEDYDTFTHTFGFCDEKCDDGNYYSALILQSGAAINAVVPDENGYVEIYAYQKIGQGVAMDTDFSYSRTGASGAGGGKALSPMVDLTVGDVDFSGNTITIDDATIVQKYLADISKLSNLQVRNADTNADGEVTVDDVTTIQKYIANLI